MSREPRVEVIPRKPAVCSESSVVLDVLVRVTPPPPEVHFPRPVLNLGLVLDRSGSMASGKKMSHAHQAATFAVEQLLPTDRVSVTIFDDHVDVLAANAPAADKPGLVRMIQKAVPRGCTNLHGGWLEGANQTALGLAALEVEPGIGSAGAREAVNRVILLSDGIANAGVTDPNTIATEVKGFAARGVSTTTMGMGDDYNEDLLEAMARAGDGQYYYVETPTQLADIFQSELKGLMALYGQKVSLGVEPADGVTVSDLLNDFDRTTTGRLMLPNLAVGMPVPVLIRLTVPARTASGPICSFRLAWDDTASKTRKVMTFALEGLPARTQAEWDALAPDPDIVEQEALLMAARAQREAAHAMDRGDYAGSVARIRTARNYLGSAPMSAPIMEMMASLDSVQERFDEGDYAASSKRAKFAAYRRSHGRADHEKTEPPTSPPTTPPADPKQP